MEPCCNVECESLLGCELWKLVRTQPDPKLLNKKEKRLHKQGHPCLRESRKRFTSGAKHHL